MESGTITIPDSEKNYELYYQCIEIEDSVYEEITNSNTTKERRMELIPKYNESNWIKSTDNKFLVETSKYTGKKAFAIWTKLKSSDGTVSYDVDIYSVTGTKSAEEKKDDKVETENKSHKYEIIEKVMTWKEAKEYCESKGGYLVTITSKEEQKKIEELIKAKNYGNKKIRFWIGATDEETEGQWKWVTGEKFDYANWGEKVPDNRKDQDFACMQNYEYSAFGIKEYQWDDINNEQSKDVVTYFICETGEYEKTNVENKDTKVENKDVKDETTSTTKIPQTGQSYTIIAIITMISIIGIAGYKFISKNRDIK